ncbi:MAG TPA: ABC transporter permease [Thermoanaerobaculia bacterium]|nr:ABC transporter permease [Thermoanaerobaculia bacterium]
MSPRPFGRRPPLALLFVVALCAVALAAGLLAPHDPEELVDPAASAGRPPLTRLWAIEPVEGRVLVVDDQRRVGDRLVLSRLGQTVELPVERVATITRRDHWLGTDSIGRDLLSRILFGARTSLLVGVLSAILALGGGVLIGAAAALGGRWLDQLLMRLVDGVLAFPTLLLVLACALLFEPSLWVLIALIGGTGSLVLARLTRAELLVLLGQPFVEAIRGLGGGPLRLFFAHLLPNAATPILVATSLVVADAILMEATVSYLGLGVASSGPSWGRIIADGAPDLGRLWWISTLPGLMLVLTALAFNTLADRARDALDPATRGADRVGGTGAGRSAHGAGEALAA